MKVTLVNTNRYLLPPTIPIGLEYLVAPLEDAGHSVDICDLAFSKDCERDLVSFLDSSRPDAVGVTVRNIDTVMFENNTFFLDDIADVVKITKMHTGKPVIVGGTASYCATDALLTYLGADYLVAGPGEKAFPDLLRLLETGGEPPRILDGWNAGILPDIVHSRGHLVDYQPYLEGGNPAGIEFRKGCAWGCPFCVERKRPVLEREIDAVVAECRALADKGVKTLFICDSEVNMDPGGTKAFLSALAQQDLGMEWTGYFRPVPFDGELAVLASTSGCRTLTVSVDSWELSGAGGIYSAGDVTRFVDACKGEGIKVAVDLLVGYPGETRDSIEKALELLREAQPATVGVTSHFRLYEEMPILDDIKGSAGITGEMENNPGMLEPVFYSGIDRGWLEQRTSGDPLFKLEGKELTVNYQRVTG